MVIQNHSTKEKAKQKKVAICFYKMRTYLHKKERKKKIITRILIVHELFIFFSRHYVYSARTDESYSTGTRMRKK